MKKLIAALLLLTTTLLLFTACFGAPDNSGNAGGAPDPAPLKIGYMSGPTGMGMAKLIHDNGGIEGNEKYSFTAYTDTALAKADLTKGDIDIICIPTNEALAYYNTVDSKTRMLAINCLNSLYVISKEGDAPTALSELEGKTVYTCKNGTPKIILEYIINALDLDITVSTSINGVDMAKPADVQAQVIAGALPYAVIPEPLITASLLKNGEYKVVLDLADEWARIPECEGTTVAMGCIVANADFLAANSAQINAFLDEYKASVEYVGDAQNLENAANYVAEAKIMAAAPAAKKALANLGSAIAYIDGEEMKTTLAAFYTAIGMTPPGDEFYYGR